MKKESAYSIEHHESGRFIAWRLNGKRKLRLGSFETYELADQRIEQAIEVLER